MELYLGLLHIGHIMLPHQFFWSLCISTGFVSAELMVSAKTAVRCRYFHSQVGSMELNQGLHPVHENLTAARWPGLSAPCKVSQLAHHLLWLRKWLLSISPSTEDFAHQFCCVSCSLRASWKGSSWLFSKRFI